MFDKLIGAGILAFCLVAGGCVYVPSVDPGVTPSDITWTVQETGAEFADGNTGGMPVKSSDGIQITFNADVDDLVISDIEITFAGAPVTAELSGSGTVWTALFTVTATNYASVKINRTGIKSGPQNVMVYLKDTLPPLIDDNTVLYVDFDDGTFQGVEASGDTTRATVTAAQFHSAPYSYFITGRAANSNGASWNQGAYLLPGKTYTFSVWFYHEQAASQNMQLFVNYNQGSGFAATGGTRVAVANKSVPRGTWTQVSGNLTPPADCVVTRMIIQNNTSLCDFYIDDIKIELKSGTPESAAIQESLLGIKDAPQFKSKNLLIGAGIGNTVLQDPHGNRQALAAKHFNS
ncbi:MAG: carbohydrate binding domain-containing protein, partial [Treponema sp.]|nr:carbohydrate binding domain-containing protein [Treponema sp.]